MIFPALDCWTSQIGAGDHADPETTLIYAYADTEMKSKAIEQATSAFNPLNSGVDSASYWKNDDEMIRKLYGLK